MRHLALSLLLATAAHADTEAPEPYKVKRDPPGCQSVADLDRIMLMALEQTNPLQRERAQACLRRACGRTDRPDD